MKPQLSTVVCLFAISIGAIGQTTAEFEVATVKPATLKGGIFIRMTSGGRLNVTNFTLRDLITWAWGIYDFQVFGGPAWIASERFDITAKPDHPGTWKETMGMLQSLLASRFGLALHHETKELPIYALILARSDGKLGPKLAVSKAGGCTPFDQSTHPFSAGKTCGLSATRYRGTMQALSFSMDSFAKWLSPILGRTVFDKTGLPGNFDIELNYAPDENQLLPPGMPLPPPNGAPDIFTAVREQLGLKLESQKGPVESFVIDRAEKPSEN